MDSFLREIEGTNPKLESGLRVVGNKSLLARLTLIRQKKQTGEHPTIQDFFEQSQNTGPPPIPSDCNQTPAASRQVSRPIAVVNTQLTQADLPPRVQQIFSSCNTVREAIVMLKHDDICLGIRSPACQVLLRRACEERDFFVIRQIIESGAPLPCAAGENALHYVLRQGPAGDPDLDNLMRVVKYLVSKNVDVNELDHHGRTPAFLACAYHVPLLNVLTAKGGIIIQRDFRSLTPLHVAAQGGNVETCRYLIALDHDPRARSTSGWSVTHAAVMADRKDPGVLGYLLNKGAPVNAQESRNGRTPLLEAVVGDAPNATIIRLLLKRGARLEIADHHGVTPLQAARRCLAHSSGDLVRRQIVKLLRAGGR